MPPYSEKLNIIKDILGHTLCKDHVKITCSQLDQSIESNIRYQLRDAQGSDFQCIVVHCTQKLHAIFLLAKEYDMLGPKYRWFLTAFVEIDESFKELPENLISVELSYYSRISKLGDTECGHESYLNDGLVLVASMKQALETDFERNITR